MKEILTMGDISKDFKRLGIEVRQTYIGKRYGICEVTEEELEKIFSEPDENINGTWEDCGIEYWKGSNLPVPNSHIVVNGKVLFAWYNYFENKEEKQAYLNKFSKIKLEKYNSLLEYLCDYMGCSLPKNICILTKDLAKYNGMKMSELFKKYQPKDK